MNFIQQALTEVLQSYKLVYKPIIKIWRIKNSIRVANNEFLRTGRQYFVLKHDTHDCEVLSKVQLDYRLHILKKTNPLFRNATIQDIRKACIYMTPEKIYTGNLNAFGIPVKGSQPEKIVDYSKPRVIKKLKK